MNILILWRDMLSWGGVTNLVYNLTIEYRKKGHRVKIITLDEVRQGLKYDFSEILDSFDIISTQKIFQ